MRQRDGYKEQLIRQKALEMIVKEGLDGLSMQKLAKMANVSPATLYIYFKDRDDLILQLTIEENRKLTEETLRNFSADLDLSEGLRLQWNNRIEYYRKYPLSLIFMEQMKFSPYHVKAMEQVEKSFPVTMGDFLKSNIKRKQLIKISPEIFWSLAFAPLYQLIKFHMSGKGLAGTGPFILTDTIVQDTLQIVIRSLKP